MPRTLVHVPPLQSFIVKPDWVDTADPAAHPDGTAPFPGAQ